MKVGLESPILPFFTSGVEVVVCLTIETRLGLVTVSGEKLKSSAVPSISDEAGLCLDSSMIVFVHIW
ncbi:hypothetical protein RYX36_020013 [Vicia faba]